MDPNAKLIFNNNEVEGAGLPHGRSVKADAMYELLKSEERRRKRTPRGGPLIWSSRCPRRVISSSTKREDTWITRIRTLPLISPAHLFP